MIFALLILLNMLLAIIMENYAAVTDELMSMPDAPTLYQQCVRYYHRWQTSRKGGFSPLGDFLVELTDGENTHPEKVVTHDSMKQAFPNMKDEQAAFLMKWLQKDADSKADKQSDDEVLLRMKKCHALMQTIAENLHAVSLSVMRCDTRLHHLEIRQQFMEQQEPQQQPTSPGLPPPPMEPAAEPPVPESLARGIAGQLDSQQRVMKELCEQLAKQQRSSENMARALAELAQLVPREAPPPQPQAVIRQGLPLQLPACCGTDQPNYRR